MTQRAHTLAEFISLGFIFTTQCLKFLVNVMKWVIATLVNAIMPALTTRSVPSQRRNRSFFQRNVYQAMPGLFIVVILLLQTPNHLPALPGKKIRCKNERFHCCDGTLRVYMPMMLNVHNVIHKVTFHHIVPFPPISCSDIACNVCCKKAVMDRWINKTGAQVERKVGIRVRLCLYVTFHIQGFPMYSCMWTFCTHHMAWCHPSAGLWVD